MPMPHIVVINESSAIADADVQAMIPAFQQQWNSDLRSIWGVDQADFEFLPNTQQPPAGTWWTVFLDDSDQAGALAYHDLTDDGWPLSKVFVRTIIADNNGSISVAATHELCEMAVDPWLNSAYQDQNGTFWAGEVCDPVEADEYGYMIGSVRVTDFVTPNWFGHQRAQTQMDLQSHANSTFEVLSGGYAQQFDPQRGWVQISGSRAGRSKMALHMPPGSRRDRRVRQWKHPLERSHRTLIRRS